MSKKKKIPKTGASPKFCFICGYSLIETGNYGSLQCAKCGEVYFPFIDNNGNQCLGHKKTIFSPK